MRESVKLMKAKRFVRSIKTVMVFFFWCSIIGIILSVIGGIIIPFLPKDIFIIKDVNHLGFVLSMDGLIRYHAVESNIGISTISIYRSIAVIAAICFIGIAILLRQIVMIIKNVEKDQPFIEENANRLIIIGIVLLIGSVLFRFAGAMVAKSIINTLQINDISVTISTDIFMFLTGIMMLILGGVFKYGNYLQEEYDTTL